MSDAPEMPQVLVYADIQCGHGNKHHYHARLAIEPQFGPVLRMGFLPPLREGEAPVMPFNPEQLREFAAGALRMAEDWEASRDDR